MAHANKIEKTVKIVSLNKQPTDFAYWQSQPMEARLEALETIRAEFHGWTDENPPRLEKVLRIIER